MCASDTVCVCVCTCTCVCLCVHLSVCVYTCMYMVGKGDNQCMCHDRRCVCVWSVCLSVCVHLSVLFYAHVCECVCTSVCLCVYTAEKFKLGTSLLIANGNVVSSTSPPPPPPPPPQDAIGGRLTYKGRLELDKCQVTDMPDGTGKPPDSYS